MGEAHVVVVGPRDRNPGLGGTVAARRAAERVDLDLVRLVAQDCDGLAVELLDQVFRQRHILASRKRPSSVTITGKCMSTLGLDFRISPASWSTRLGCIAS